MRSKAFLLVGLLLVPATAGCLGDVAQGLTNILFYVSAAPGVLAQFRTVEVVVTHAVFRANESGVQPEFVPVGQSVDLVQLREGGERKLFEHKIPYRIYDKVSVGMNVTLALRSDGSPTEVMTPQNKIYETQDKPFRTRLAGDVAYYWVVTVQRSESTGEYFLQLRNEETGARRA